MIAPGSVRVGCIVAQGAGAVLPRASLRVVYVPAASRLTHGQPPVATTRGNERCWQLADDESGRRRSSHNALSPRGLLVGPTCRREYMVPQYGSARVWLRSPVRPPAWRRLSP